MRAADLLLCVTRCRHDLAAEVGHIKKPARLPPVLSAAEVKRVLTSSRLLRRIEGEAARKTIPQRNDQTERGTVSGTHCGRQVLYIFKD
jgi:hypothetical protein